VSLLAHLVWLALLLVLGTLAILSIWSDVWVAFVGVFLLTALGYGLTYRRTRPRRP